MDTPPNIVIRSASCSWCRTMNRETTSWCRHCGHAAHKPRMLCDCPQCQPHAPAHEGEERAHDHA